MVWKMYPSKKIYAGRKSFKEHFVRMKSEFKISF